MNENPSLPANPNSAKDRKMELPDFDSQPLKQTAAPDTHVSLEQRPKFDATFDESLEKTRLELIKLREDIANIKWSKKSFAITSAITLTSVLLTASIAFWTNRYTPQSNQLKLREDAINAREAKASAEEQRDKAIAKLATTEQQLTTADEKRKLAQDTAKEAEEAAKRATSEREAAEKVRDNARNDTKDAREQIALLRQRLDQSAREFDAINKHLRPRMQRRDGDVRIPIQIANTSQAKLAVDLYFALPDEVRHPDGIRGFLKPIPSRKWTEIVYFYERDNRKAKDIALLVQLICKLPTPPTVTLEKQSDGDISTSLPGSIEVWLGSEDVPRYYQKATEMAKTPVGN